MVRRTLISRLLACHDPRVHTAPRNLPPPSTTHPSPLTTHNLLPHIQVQSIRRMITTKRMPKFLAPTASNLPRPNSITATTRLRTTRRLPSRQGKRHQHHSSPAWHPRRCSLAARPSIRDKACRARVRRRPSSRNTNLTSPQVKVMDPAHRPKTFTDRAGSTRRRETQEGRASCAIEMYLTLQKFGI